ncbi:DUF1510 family protein [Fictibacillus sp. WQ 8-8]|uniref:DUF1510 family protein n=1 Tax=Fictibacillus sp. WQ 8-8 TaxID=2938788 RepID=UPI0021097407|nr:DUF1510 family protein [Fictibacillus sp. WQ 8-8]MCQ6267393.1 DUF1510 family protein [Fictibacillus sp. WQ 8-8]
MRSRFQRQKRKKLHVSLNALICIVLVLIFIVAGNIIWGDSNEASTNNPQNQTRSKGEQNNQQNNDTTIRKDKETDLKNHDIKLRENKKTKDQQEAKRIQKDSEEAKKEQKAEKDREEQKAKEAKEEREKQRSQDEKKVTGSGSSEPIGTSQTGPHTSSYVEDSVDWNEKVKAIQMATGLGDNMNIWRIENGGGPQKSVGKVSPDGEDSWMYVVNLEWVDQKGWKVTSVSKQNR